MNITTNYYNEQVNNSITIIDNLDIAYNLYTTLMEDLNNKSSLPSFSDLFVKLAEIYNKSGFYHSPVLIEKSEDLCYPMAMNMYWAVHISNKNNMEEKEKDILVSKKYLDALYSTDSNYKSAEQKAQDFSKKKREIKTELFNRLPFDSYLMAASQKYHTYRSILLSLVESNDHKPLEMPETDKWFYILNHNRTFYCTKKPIKAKTFKTLYELLTEYERIYFSHDSKFDKELSAFMMEKMLHGLSYTHAFLSFLQSYDLTDKSEIPRKAIALHCKFFNSPYNSQINYLSSNNKLNNETADENTLFSLYFTAQFHNTFLLQLLNYVITLAVNRIHDGEYDIIEKYVKDYIENCSMQPYTYSSKFEKTMRNIKKFDEILENENTDSNSFKRAVLFCEPRKNKQAKLLNQFFYEAFYENCRPFEDNYFDGILCTLSNPKFLDTDKSNRMTISFDKLLQDFYDSYFSVFEHLQWKM